jgi:hypothetical protein
MNVLYSRPLAIAPGWSNRNNQAPSGNPHTFHNGVCDMKKLLVIATALSLVSLPAFAVKPCDELKTEIAAKLDEKGVTGYTLDIVASDQIGEQTVVGSCEGGSKKITYTRAGSNNAAAPAQ